MRTKFLLEADPFPAAGVMPFPAADRVVDRSARGRLARFLPAALTRRAFRRFDLQAWEALWHAARRDAIARVPFYCEASFAASCDAEAPADGELTATEAVLERQLHRFFPFAAPLDFTWEAERRRYQDTTLAEALSLADVLRPDDFLVEIRDSLCDAPAIDMPMTSFASARLPLFKAARQVRRLVWLSDEAVLDPLAERNLPEDWPDDRCRMPLDRPFKLLGGEADLVRWWAAHADRHRPAGILVKLSLCADDPMEEVRQRLLDRMPGIGATEVAFMLHHRLLGYLAAARTLCEGFRLNWRRFHCAPCGRTSGLLFSDIRRRRPAIINYRPDNPPVTRLLLAEAPLLA